MRLQQIVRNEDNRRIRVAAGAIGVIGLSAIIQAILGGAEEGVRPAVLAALGVGVLFLGLAFGTLRGSRAAAATALGLYVLAEAFAVLVHGPVALASVWFWVGFAVLASGVRAVWSEHRAAAAG